ncbi:SseB family protein [Aliishimia ponticola]|uniref:SseB family protein n=1 Tax=Aliishimia ponticola TaxID=2499833 RepID=A0A4S4NBD3_9RHOB|nr:SseB family protein [Aliishimia ponticola]THH35985.1 SseB family protein [Aliishimia ponticola]
MTEPTPLDQAHALMDSSDAARLNYFATLADTELCLLLESEPDGDDITPRLIETGDGPMVLAFDTELRLAEFSDGPAPYVALPGRIVAQMLDGQGILLGLNLDTAPSAIVLPPDALTWLVQTLGQDAPDAAEARIKGVASPGQVPEALLEALSIRLARAAGLAEAACLARADYADGGQGHLLAIIGAEARAEPALARMVSEALTFSGLDAGQLDVVFVAPQAPLAEKLTRVGMRFDIPAAPDPKAATPAAPGMDPDKPPKLR